MDGNGFDFSNGTDLKHGEYYAYPYSIGPLPAELRRGLIAPGICGTLSVLSTTILLCFITYRFVVWKKHYNVYIGYNQYILLIMNLLIADLLQGMSFLVSWHWIRIDAILAPTRACFAQGWLIQIGDVASGFFVFFIAFHTFYCTVKGRRFDHKVFMCLIGFTWVVSLTLSSIGPLMHREDYFVRAGAWCWASSKYEQDRLALHYIWVFMVQFGTVIIYALVLLHLRKTMNIILPTASQTATYAKIDRAAKLMILYPLVYIVLTLPLSAGRMWSMAHGGANLPDAYACLAGAFLASTGFVDSLLYTLTRKQLLKGNTDNHGSGSGKKNSQGWFKRSNGTSSDQLSGLGSILGTVSWKDNGASNQLDPNRIITQTRTVTVTGRRASAATEDVDQFEMSERGRPMPSSANKKRISVTERGVSPTGSLDPIIASYPRGQTQGLMSKGTTTEVSAVRKDSSGDTDTDVDSITDAKEVKDAQTFYQS